jgi:heat shock protein HslJ
MWGIRAIAVLAVTAALSGCGEETGDDESSGGDDVSALSGRTLVVTAVTDDGRPHDLVPGSQVRFTFDDKAMGITAGCNNLSGDYTLDGDRLTVGPIGGTEMGCSAPLMDQDTWLAGLFEAPVTVGGDPLTFRAGSVVLTLADREDVSPDLPLAGTHWVLDGMIDGDAASSVPGASEAWLEVAEDGTVTANTGCNRGSGRVTIDDATLTFGPLATTRRACADPSAQQVERAILAVLDGETAYSITERSLTITKGDRGLTFRAG